MSTISASTTSTTGFKVTSDTTGTLVLQTGSTPTTAATIDASQNVGINNPSSTIRTKLMVSSSNSSDTLTVGTVSGGFSITNTNSAYGLQFGSLSTGNSWIQSARMDGTATAYNLLLQPGGGNVGFGTLSPANLLHVSTSTSANSKFEQTSTSANYLTLRSNSSDRAFIGLEDSSGNGLFGSGSAYGLSIGTTGATDFAFVTTNAVRGRFDSSGNLLFSCSSVPTAGGQNGIALRPNGVEVANTPRFDIVGAASTVSNTIMQIYSQGASAYRFYIQWNGQIYATQTTILGISDERLKENIVDLDAGLDKIMALKPRKFDWKEGKGKDIKGDRGFIAQEFETIFPDLVENYKGEAPEGEEPYKAVKQELIPVLVKAIQEQQAIIETLTNRITALEAK